MNFFNRIHIETSSVLIRQLPLEFLQCPSVWHYAPTNASMKLCIFTEVHIILCVLVIPIGENELITVPAGKVKFGKPKEFPSYGWDCEYGEVNMKLVINFKYYKYINIKLKLVCIATH